MNMNLTLKIWRQKNASDKGKMVDYKVSDISPDMSFLEMLDVLNEQLINKDEEPVAFDHDCREGICGMCSLYINGEAHGPDRGVTTCQLHMRMFKDGDTITIEPFRATAFPVVKDLIVDRSSFDRIQHAGLFVGAKVSQFALLPQGKVEAADRVLNMVKQMDEEGFGNCTNTGACEVECPKG